MLGDQLRPTLQSGLEKLGFCESRKSLFSGPKTKNYLRVWLLAAVFIQLADIEISYDSRVIIKKFYNF